MKGDWLPQVGANRYVEPLFALLILGGISYVAWHIIVWLYVPQPFFYDVLDTWMDWFNTSFWARQSGTYSEWRTVYPPISFVFLRIFGIDQCYEGTAFAARDCDWLGYVTLLSFFALNVLLLARIFIKLDRRTAIPRTIALALGFPMLAALERGQPLIVAYTFFLLGFGPLLHSAKLRWLAVAVAINFKFYLIMALLAQLIRRRWFWFERALLTTIMVYAVTYGLNGVGTPTELVDNIINFQQEFNGANNFLDVWYAGNYQPMVKLLNGTYPMTHLIGSSRVEVFSFLLPLLSHSVQFLLLAAMAAVWLRPEVVTIGRLTYLALAFTFLTSEGFGYVQIYMIFFVFQEPWRGFGRKWAIIACYVLCVPLEYQVAPLNPIARESFVGGRLAFPNYGVTLGPFLRPALFLSIATALACVTIREVWREIRVQGWRERRRYRRDLPLLTGKVEPSPA